MDLDREDHSGVTLLRPHGDLTGGEPDPLLTAVTNLLGGSGVRIVLDLSQVAYVNSAGLADLVRIVAQANVQEARIILANPSPHVAGVLEMTRLDRFFEIRRTATEALAELRG